jgi:TonB family protein
MMTFTPALLTAVLAFAAPVPAPQAPPAPTVAPTVGPCRLATKNDIVTNAVPVYPASAKDFGTQGDIAVRIDIAADGKVIAVSLVLPRGGRLRPLELSSVDAARHMVFRPLHLPTGESTHTLCVTFSFRMTGRSSR